LLLSSPLACYSLSSPRFFFAKGQRLWYPRPVEQVAWTAHPAKERPRDLALFACVLFMTLGATLMAFNSLFLTTLAGFILTIGVSQFLFPTHYSLSDWGVEAKGLVRTKARRWAELRRYEVGKGAALVSPLARRSWLDRYRGIILMFDSTNRDRIVNALNQRFSATSTDARDEEE